MKRQFFLCSLFCALASYASAQKVYELNAPKTPMQIVEGKLDMGGTSPTGGSMAR